MNFSEKKITDGISLITVKTQQFKTNEIAVSLAVPLTKESAGVNALVINMLSRKSRELPTMSMLNKKLAYLYGASVSAVVSKLGECQVLKLGISCLDDRFSLDSESISFECIKLLFSLLTEPRFDESGNFFSDDIEAEKRILIEKIQAENNEKRTYVLRQAEKLMFENEAYSVNRYGDVESITAITKEQCKQAYNNLLSSAKILVTVVGNTDTKKTAEYISHVFSKHERNYQVLEGAQFIPACDKVKEKMERIDVKQGKLVLGFRVNLRPEDKLTDAMRSFCDIFGGGPYSKLFANVREKLSLCYYCSARYTKLKSFIMIQCGCNEENMDKAVNEILNQLEIIKSGDFDEEFNSSKIGLRDAILSVNDTPELIEAWYANQMTQDSIKTPEQTAKSNDDVTKEQIIECANLLTLDTVYKLSSPREDK